MDLLTKWLRGYLPALDVTDEQLAHDLTLRGIAVEGSFPAACGGARFEMDITTNRVDAMNHYGVAREAAAIYDVPLAPLAGYAAPPAPDGPLYPVRIDAPDLCGRFTARVVRNVTIAPSRGDIAAWFQALGQKCISNAVDITNFVWMAMGQPTHVFDLDKVEGELVVRRAHAGERLRLLDGIERLLVPDDLVVADSRKALGLAGIMGGWDARVTEATTNILVEAAWFQPATIRASSRRHGLHTDASHRFERGADFNAAPLANALVVQLLLAECAGEVAGGLTDVLLPAWQARTAERAAVLLPVAEVRRHLGQTADGPGLSAEVIERTLTALGCVLALREPGVYSVSLPSWRLDLERPIDLIEEVARVYGYNRFADTLPGVTGVVRQLPHIEQERTLRHTLRALGYSEAISTTFAAAAEAAAFASGASAFGASGDNEPVALGNPLSAEAGLLRPSLLPAMASMLAHNLHRDVDTVRLFELGTVFTGSPAAVHEAASLALGVTGSAPATALHTPDDALFYLVKGALEALLARFAGTVRFDADALPAWIAPGRGARVLLDDQPIAVFGQLSADEQQRRKLRQPCVLAEVAAQALLNTPLRAPVARELSRFQAVERDFSFVFPDAVRWAAIHTALAALALPEMQRAVPLEVFRDAKGKAVPTGQYSLLVRASFQSPAATLTEEQLTGWSDRVVTALTSLGGVQRA